MKHYHLILLVFILEHIGDEADIVKRFPDRRMCERVIRTMWRIIRILGTVIRILVAVTADVHAYTTPEGPANARWSSG